MRQTEASLVKPGAGQQKFLSKLISRFMTAHHEMSNSRLDFIVVQNGLNELKKKEAQLDDLGEGFSLADYENLKSELQTISSNVDMRKEQVDMMQKRFLRDQEKCESIKERIENIVKSTEEKSSECELLKAEENLMRDEINQLEIQKQTLRDELNELSQKAGILTQVPLMRDFDALCDEISKLSNELSEITANMKLLEAQETNSSTSGEH